MSLTARRRDIAAIAEETWDGLLAASPAATPFSRHCLQEAWWDAYGAKAHEETLVVVDDAGRERIAGIVPLMHRHELEPGDVEARTTLRHEACRELRPVPDSATAVFFGASYHADYATVLAAPADLEAVCEAAADYLAGPAPEPWDVVDLRRLRRNDPAADALHSAFEVRASHAGWAVSREEEEVCPVLTLPAGLDFEAYLDTLDKKERHEIRRKVRRAEAAGPVSLEKSDGSAADLEAFVDLHQKRWGADGLFPPTEGGAASRRFFAGLIDSCAPTGIVELHFLTVGGRRIAAGVTMVDAQTVYYYNAGVDPDARDLSPGVVMVAWYVKQAIERGARRLDFMRGNEPYKYAWGAVDERIDRLLVRRTDAATVSEAEAAS
jgi:CelD/BcsL family acetyltransferase involved in cellulose biosynthesis